MIDDMHCVRSKNNVFDLNMIINVCFTIYYIISIIDMFFDVTQPAIMLLRRDKCFPLDHIIIVIVYRV